jgi:radical SAM superfamily enzyme YgiQ (UPF0313 family)
MPPLGLAWLATSLLGDGLSVSILDRQVDPREFDEVFKAERPAILGISSTTATRFEAFRYAAEAKRLAPETFVVFGGSHATCTARDTLLNLPQFDAVVIGEGEATMLALARRVLEGSNNLAGIRGIAYRDGDEIIESPPAERIRDLDTLGFPARHLLPNDLYKLENEFIGGSAFHIMASRGCPFRCSFCSAASIWGFSITYRTPAHIADEMEYLHGELGAEGFRFMDALVTMRRSFINDLCDEIERRNIRLPWECEVRVDTVDEEVLRRMRKAGCYYLDFGAESVNADVLERMHKKITPEQITEALVLSHKLGFKTKVFFTFGHIGETYSNARETLRFIHKHSRYITRIGGGIGINIFPGTEVEEYAHEIGCLPEDFSWSQEYDDQRNLFYGTSPSVPVLIQPQFGWKEMRSLRRLHLLEKLRDPKIWASNLRRLGDPIALRRLARIFTGVFRRGDGSKDEAPAG